MFNLRPFWWFFAVRGGFAVLFAGILLYMSALLGTFFFDPILLVIMGVLIGFYVLGNGILLAVAAVFAAEHHLRVWRLLLSESIFALALGTYVGFSLFVSPRSVALMAGLHALGTGVFECALAFQLRHDRKPLLILASSGLLTLGVGVAFLLHQSAGVRPTTGYLSGFELLYGALFLFFAVAMRTAPLAPGKVALEAKSPVQLAQSPA